MHGTNGVQDKKAGPSPFLTKQCSLSRETRVLQILSFMDFVLALTENVVLQGLSEAMAKAG